MCVHVRAYAYMCKLRVCACVYSKPRQSVQLSLGVRRLWVGLPIPLHEPLIAPLEEGLGVAPLVLLEQQDGEEVGGLEGVGVVFPEHLGG